MLSRLATTAQPSQQQVVDYLNAIGTVSTYAQGVASSNLSALNHPPSWYASFAEAFATAKGHALVWTKSVVPNLAAAPQSLVAFNTVLQQRSATLQQALATLRQDPANQAARATVSTTVSYLVQAVQTSAGMATGIGGNVDQFGSQLDPDAQLLATYSGDALASASTADQQLVAKLNGQIQLLQDQIKTLNEIVTLQRAYAGDIAIFVVIVAATIGWVGGPVIDMLLGMGVLGLAAGIGPKVKAWLQDPDVTGLQQTISALSQEIGAVNSEIATLQNLSTTFNQLVAANATARQAIQAIESLWQTLEGDLAAVVRDLNQVSTDVSAAQWETAAADLQTALTAWQEVAGFAQVVAGVQYNFPSDVLTIPQGS
jgi:hypothetical protein